jgi:hypothetical protein
LYVDKELDDNVTLSRLGGLDGARRQIVDRFGICGKL